jgi:hypothetical protein
MDPTTPGSSQMDKLDRLRGMPLGFPFAMVLLGIAAFVPAAILGGIDSPWCRNFAAVMLSLGEHLIIAGAVLQSVLWICGAFGKPKS